MRRSHKVYRKYHEDWRVELIAGGKSLAEEKILITIYINDDAMVIKNLSMTLKLKVDD